jgi:hypothetical protein
MPNRLLRDWTDSEKVDRLSPGAETLFVRLLMKADDFGRYVAKPRLLCAACYPLKPGMTEKQVACWCLELARAGLIVLYEVDGKKYLEIVNFGQRLRAKRSRYPAPSASNMTAPGGDVRTSAGKCPQNGSKTTPIQLFSTDTPGSSPQTGRPESESESESETEENKDSSALAKEPTAEPTVAWRFKTIGPVKEWILSKAQVEIWEKAFPDTDIMAVVRHSDQWLDANRRKTANGMKRFLVGFIGRAANSGEHVPRRTSSPLADDKVARNRPPQILVDEHSAELLAAVEAKIKRDTDAVLNRQEKPQ